MRKLRIDEVEVIKCPECGEELDVGSNYCSLCGTSVSKVQPQIVRIKLSEL